MESAEEGRRYRVKWDDCCAAGSFEAVLERKNYVPDPPEPEPFLESLTFDNGVTISGRGVALDEAPRRPVTVTLADGSQSHFSATEYRTDEDGTLRVLDGSAELARYEGESWERAAIEYLPPDEPA